MILSITGAFTPTSNSRRPAEFDFQDGFRGAIQYVKDDDNVMVVAVLAFEANCAHAIRTQIADAMIRFWEICQKLKFPKGTDVFANARLVLNAGDTLRPIFDFSGREFPLNGSIFNNCERIFNAANRVEEECEAVA